eukprot:1158048-Pelagomonas_calceolata.AAC.7
MVAKKVFMLVVSFKMGCLLLLLVVIRDVVSFINVKIGHEDCSSAGAIAVHAGGGLTDGDQAGVSDACADTGHTDGSSAGGCGSSSCKWPCKLM